MPDHFRKDFAENARRFAIGVVLVFVVATAAMGFGIYLVGVGVWTTLTFVIVFQYAFSLHMFTLNADLSTAEEDFRYNRVCIWVIINAPLLIGLAIYLVVRGTRGPVSASDSLAALAIRIDVSLFAIIVSAIFRRFMRSVAVGTQQIAVAQKILLCWVVFMIAGVALGWLVPFHASLWSAIAPGVLCVPYFFMAAILLLVRRGMRLPDSPMGPFMEEYDREVEMQLKVEAVLSRGSGRCPGDPSAKTAVRPLVQTARNAVGSEDPGVRLVMAFEVSERHQPSASVASVALSDDAWHAFSIGLTYARRVGPYGTEGPLVAPHTLKIWNRHDGRVLRTHEFKESEGERPLTVKECSGTIVASFRAGVLRLWNPVTDLVLATLEVGSGNLVAHATDLALTEDDMLAVLATRFFYRPDNNTVMVWNLKTGDLRTLQGHSKTVDAVVTIPDGRWPEVPSPRHRAVSASLDHAVKVWDLDDCREIRTLKGHTDVVRSIAASPDGLRIVSGSKDKTIKIWDTTTWQSRTICGHEDEVTALAFVPGHSAFVSGARDRSIKLWDIDSGALLAAFILDAPVSTCAIGPGLTVMVGDTVGGVHFLRIDGLDGT